MAGGTIPYTEGDTSPDLDIVLTGTDISAYGSIRVHIAYATPLTKAAAVVDGPNGRARVTWADGDLRAGNWPAEIQTTDASGKVTTWRGLRFDIAKQIA